MEINVTENYHKILGHLIIAGEEILASLCQRLSSARILSNDDLIEINSVISVKEKAEIVLNSLARGQQSFTLCRYLDEIAPHVMKSLMTQVSVKDAGSRSLRGDAGSNPNLSQSLEIVSCERDLLNEDLKTVSKRLERMSEQLAHSQAESAGLKRQSEGDRQELTMLRRKILAGGGGNPVLNKMYETLVERYDCLKRNHEALQMKFDEESNSSKDGQLRLQLCRDELADIRARYNALAREQDARLSQLHNMSDKNDSLQRDLHRVRDERTLIKREYSLVMSERDAVHKEIQKLTEDIADVNRQLSEVTNEKKSVQEEKERLIVEINSLKQNRGSQQSLQNVPALQEEIFVAQRERKQALAQYEAQLHEAYVTRKALETANDAILKLKNENKGLVSKVDSLNIELKEATVEARDAMRNRVMAFNEREKMRCERDEIKKTFDKLAEDKEIIMKQLETEIKEHDATKEAKKRLRKQLHDLQPHGSAARINVSTSSGRRDNTDSHDSAIDTCCEFGSEEISTLEGGGVPRRLKTFQYKLPRQPDLNLETGLFVTRSSCPGITVEDRVVCINETSVNSDNAPQLQRLVPNSNHPCLIKVMRSGSPPPNGESLNGEFGPQSVDSAIFARSNARTVDAQCQTDSVLRFMHRPSIPNSTGDESANDTPTTQRVVHHAQTSSACKSSGGESHQSTSTYSDSTPAISHRHPSNPSFKSSDSNASFHRNLSSKREKKPRKPRGSFWSSIITKKQSPKSQTTGGTVSGVPVLSKNSNNADAKTSSGGTWPRVEVHSEGLSVFDKKKTRPRIDSSTFTPPAQFNAGQTPPTFIRGLVASPTSPQAKSFQDPVPRAPKRQRPVSVPGFSPLPPNSSNNNNSRHAPPIPESSVDPVTSQPQTRPTNIVGVTSKVGVNSEHNHIFRPGFHRNQSVPPTPTIEKAVAAIGSPQSQIARGATQPSLEPRSAKSLPRPTSAKTTSSRASSVQSFIDPTQIKPGDYRRIRIPSEHSVVMRVSGSEKGSINLSDRSTPILFNKRCHSPAATLPSSPPTPFHSTPAFHPTSMLQTSALTPAFYPSSTPLIPSPTTSVPPTPTQHLMDASVPTIPGSGLSSLSNISTSFKARRPPLTTEPRHISMVKGVEQIGISIVGGGAKGGIFVSRIIEHSLAAQSGLEYGDQLLEYNGINLRSASEELGRTIMSQAMLGDNITFLAQYNLEKYRSSIEGNLAKNPKNRSTLTPYDDREGTITPDTTPRSSPQLEISSRTQPIGQPRLVESVCGLGECVIVGGNNTGIFFQSVGEEAAKSGLKTGDEMIELNNLDLQNSTLERASMLIAKASPASSLLVYFNAVGFSKLSSESGDFFYVRTLFDNMAEGSLSFIRNSILLVDSTWPEHAVGWWSAWLLDEHGERTKNGKVPSKLMVERDSLSHKDLDDSISCAGSTTGKKLSGRRSFFKRRKPHRNSSRSSGDVKLHKSVSEASLESTETNFDSVSTPYQVVEKHVSTKPRPVVIFGPHATAVCDRLTKEHGSRFARCPLDSVMGNSADVVESFGSRVVTASTLEREMQMHRHVLLELSQDSVDRLHSHKIYPIIVIIEYSSAKKVKDGQDRVPGREKITMKQSKEMFERANSVRRKLTQKYLGAVYVHGGSSATVAKQIFTVVEREQRKVLWLPASNQLLNY